MSIQLETLKLDAAQQRVVDAHERAIVLVAGAGSGKTEIVARRIERLLTEEVEVDSRILAVSFTVKAADEIRDRLASRTGDLHRRVDTDTIHGFALTLLRMHGSKVGLPVEPEVLTRDEDRAEVLVDWLRRQGQRQPPDLVAALRRIDDLRAGDEDDELSEAWNEALEDRGAVDFPAMLTKATELARQPWFRRYFSRLYSNVVVDEAQNLTPAQYRFLCELVGPADSEFVPAMLVGDKRQSIVDFAGGDSRLLDRFVTDYRAQSFELRTNYRSAARIVDAGWEIAKALDSAPAERPQVEYPAPGELRIDTFGSEHEEAEAVARWVSELLRVGISESALAPGESRSIRPNDIAVLGRSGAAVRLVAESLNSKGIDVAVASTENDWVTSAPARALVELLAVLAAPNHRSVRKRLSALCGVVLESSEDPIEYLRRSADSDLQLLSDLDTSSPSTLMSGADGAAMNALNWSDDIAQIRAAWHSFVDQSAASSRTFGNFRQFIARAQRGESLSDGVRVLTIHKSQGREFKAVALVACNNGQIPDFRAQSENERRAELRTFYVGVTRPSRVLWLTRSRTRSTRVGVRTVDASPYLELVARS